MRSHVLGVGCELDGRKGFGVGLASNMNYK